MACVQTFCFAVFLIVSINQLNAQNSATTKPSSYFTVDANAEQTSTQNWWGDNVDNGNEITTAAPQSGITSSGVSPAIGAGQVTNGANVQAAGVVPVESATVSGGPESSSPKVSADDGNSTQSSANSNFIGVSTFFFVAYTILN